MEKKCTNCGSNKLKWFNAFIILEGDAKVYSYICTDCGHVELYGKPDELERARNLVQKEEKKKEEIEEIYSINKDLEDQTITINKEIEKQEKIVEKIKKESENEDLTVREQKAILDRLAEEQRKLDCFKQDLEIINKQISNNKNRILKIEQK